MWYNYLINYICVALILIYFIYIYIMSDTANTLLQPT
nr:MAG TPA: CCSMST1 family protein [Caudoviricetes sp.]